jgi:hypothetical protein
MKITKPDVDTLAAALHEFLLAIGESENIIGLANDARNSKETEKEIVITIVGRTYDKLAYGN